MNYIVRVQLIEYKYADNGDCIEERVLTGAESKLFDKVTASVLYSRAAEAAEAK